MIPRIKAFRPPPPRLPLLPRPKWQLVRRLRVVTVTVTRSRENGSETTGITGLADQNRSEKKDTDIAANSRHAAGLAFEPLPPRTCPHWIPGSHDSI